MKINLFRSSDGLNKTTIAAIAAFGMLILSLTWLSLLAQAGWRTAGANNCGNFPEAVDLAEDGDTIVLMILNQDSDGRTITKNLLIHGGWLSTESCNGEQVYTDTADLDAATFEFQGILSRSVLSYFDDSVLKIDPGVLTLTIQNVAFDNTFGFTADGSGLSGVISNGARIRLHNVDFSGGVATNNGGGLSLEVRGGSQLVIAKSQFVSNQAGSSGGGFNLDVYDGSQVVIENSQINSNIASSGDGGGGRIRIFNSGYITITNSDFSGNAAGGSGNDLAIEHIGTGPAYVWLINSTSDSSDIFTTGTDLTVYDLRRGIYMPLVSKNVPSNVHSAHITNIDIENNRYVVDFETTGFTPVLPGEHLHFFFNTVPPDQAGMPGSGPWEIYGGPSPFIANQTGNTAVALPRRPPGAWQMCVLVANPNHTVQANSGNCYDLP